MLIYNFDKEFIGIDAKDLKTLGFSNLSQLQAVSADFADLFVKEPGHVHNFKHVHWIDFIACADPSEESKVIINVNSKLLTAHLSIEIVYLSQNPDTKSYLIYLNSLRTMRKADDENEEDDTFETIMEIPSPTPLNIEVEKDIFIKEEPEAILTPNFKDEVSLNVEDVEVFEPVQVEKIIVSDNESSEEDFNTKESYIYDPQIASTELGLPVDLIEEFIQDFIAQAYDFKSQLYASLEEGDLDNVAILSHKLKGVAANLRVEDALDILTKLNLSRDAQKVHNYLKAFYRIIATLSGESISPLETIQKEDELVLSFKDDANNEEESDFAQEIKLDDDELILSFKNDDIEEEIIFEKEVEPENEDELPIEYSKSTVANAIGLEESVFNELFTDYIHDARQIISNMHTAIKENNTPMCIKEVLKLKGMSESMHMKSLNAHIESLMLASDNDTITKAINMIDKVIDKISE